VSFQFFNRGSNRGFMAPNARRLRRLETRLPVSFLSSLAPMKMATLRFGFSPVPVTRRGEDEFRHSKPLSQTV